MIVKHPFEVVQPSLTGGLTSCGMVNFFQAETSGLAGIIFPAFIFCLTKGKKYDIIIM